MNIKEFAKLVLLIYCLNSLFDNKRELEFGLVKYKGNINLNEEN